MSSIKQTLLDMGFEAQEVDKAISACGENVEQAMEWLLAHADDSAMDTSSDNPAQENTNAAEEVAGTPQTSEQEEKPNSEEKCNSSGGDAEDSKASDVAKSFKCDDCGKLFKTSDEVEFHAVKSGHSSFSESTEEKRPLTAEEKQQKLKDLEDKLKQRRKEKEEEERKEAIEREQKRIQMSKQIAETKRRMAEQEITRLAEERRMEKMKDKLARQKVKEDIERDKLARKEMFPSGAKTSNSPAPSQTITSPVAIVPPQKKNYDSTRLQIRLPSGPPLVHEFKSEEVLSEVRQWISLNRKDKDFPTQTFKLSTTFPRKVFNDEDMDRPLKALGLVPSAVLVVLD